MNATRPRILITDDDEGIRHLLCDTLSEEYETAEAPDGAEAIEIIQSKPPDLMILDIMMPGMDGLEVLRRLRQWSNIPVLMLSGRDKTEIKIACLDLGADDYMTKPVTPDEFLAHVRALLRRTAREVHSTSPPHFDDGYLRIDFDKREVSAAGKEVKLTKLEYTLLHMLCTNAGRVIEYDRLLETVWGEGYQNARDSLHHHVNSLRHKIEPDTQKPRYIINLPGVGYRYRPHHE